MPPRSVRRNPMTDNSGCLSSKARSTALASAVVSRSSVLAVDSLSVANQAERILPCLATFEPCQNLFRKRRAMNVGTWWFAVLTSASSVYQKSGV